MNSDNINPEVLKLFDKYIATEILNQKNPRIFNISKEKAQIISAQAIRELKDFRNEHCNDVRKMETLVLKYHLFIENCLYQLLEQSLPKPEQLLKRSSFAEKLILVEALNIVLNEKIIIKIKAINRLRNWFVHYLDKELTDQELNSFLIEIGISSKKDFNLKNLWKELDHIAGYLISTKTIIRLFPFIHLYYRNNKLLKSDPSFIIYTLILHRKFVIEYRKILKNLKVNEDKEKMGA